jgi:hypothetical protein
MSKKVDFDLKKAERLKRAYEEAIEVKAESFIFEGDEYLTSYAKYLLEHLSGVFGNNLYPQPKSKNAQ